MHSLEFNLKQSEIITFRNQPLKQYCTFGIGGLADYLIIAENERHIIDAILLCQKFEIPFKLLGLGSNVIISDEGFRGAIIINQSRSWKILDEAPDLAKSKKTIARFASHGSNFYTMEGLDYTDELAPPVIVRVSSGARVIPLMKSLYRKNITGLQWFSGIPATVGGAIYMNMHGAKAFFGDLVYSAILFDGSETFCVDQNWFAFDYDWSNLHETPAIILSADLVLRKGNPGQAQRLSRDWARRKALQPQKSAGCIFQNLSEEDRIRLDLPTPSIGYLIDKVLNLKGLQKGDAIISTAHAAFIENIGSARAKDVYFLYRTIEETAKEKLDLQLIPEVEFIGEFNSCQNL